MPPISGLKVIRSPIHGYGVITLRPVTEGDIIVYGDGFLYRESDDFDDEYSLILPPYEDNADGSEGAPMYLDLTDQTRWINHSCDPNTEVDTGWNKKTKTASAWWVALRDIAAGEELFYDYAFSAHLAMPCNCKSDRCRGVIVDEDEIDEVPEKLKPLVRRPKRRRSA
ncbi:MAG TPA: SET domain-containing protein-lysine N-methyltransferase [Kofleriaceae bacterium]|nr:SET domain-containing protein-lysine N-methyltransferase [Kofleriaceae bacterium]